MKYQELRQKFQQQVYPSKPNEWDIEDALHDLEDLDEEQQLILLQAIPTIWPISHSLSFSFLKEGAHNGRVFNQQTLAEWLRRILFYYEEGGLKKARTYMADSDIDTLHNTEESEAVALQDNLGRLRSFTRGLSGLSLDLQGSAKIYTDTETLYLPEEIDYFPTREQNFRTYTLLIGLQTSLITIGSFGRHRFAAASGPTLVEGNGKLPTSACYFGIFENQDLAKDIYQLIELCRAMEFLKIEYPGLISGSAELRRKLSLLRNTTKQRFPSLIENLFTAIILPEQKTAPSAAENHIRLTEGNDANAADERLHWLYSLLSKEGEEYRKFDFLPYMDSFNFAEAERAREFRIEENRKKFETTLSDFLMDKQLAPSADNLGNAPSESADSARIQLTKDDGNAEQKSSKAAIILNNESLDLPSDITELISQIIADLGKLPEGYVSAAFGIAGQGRSKGVGESQKNNQPVDKFIPYDEWDYRRHGYRKNWCGLRERVLKGVKSRFVEGTLEKHRGLLMKIRRQFEMMRTQERFARRRRHGDDIDLDALIDSLGDQCAGLPPSEKLFIRLIRNERSISTFFLVDMSNSTEGWIGKVIKEALVLLCEAMEVVGDRYAIYGFSGMRRMRSEVYRIKDISEHYSKKVKERLAAIGPKEYTRMGPPIRHMIKHLGKTDSKSRLLLILSDGKPEDYDDYKGSYAIEDTRKALAEARGNGVHPYCITIDREAHDYLEHLFGRGNYTFIKNIEQLPSRLTEIYRQLTR